MKTTSWRRWTVAVPLVLIAAACGGDDSSSNSTSSTLVAPAETTPLSDPDGSPMRIVSLSPTHTEMLFALDAGDQIVAVDSLSNYPEEAEAVRTDLSAYEPNVEAISAYEPDLVVIADDFTGLTEQLDSIGIPVWEGLAPTSLDDVYAQIEDLGARIGRSDEAAMTVGLMQSAVETILGQAPGLDLGLTYYHELDDTYYSVTSNTFIGQLYSLFGLRNIADVSEGTSDYPQLSAEFIVSQDPDLVFLADTVCCGVTAESVGARPGWGELSAVKAGLVFEMNDDLASRWGPRIVEYLWAINEALEKAVSLDS
ncbi:MAG: ABC transporter substrate-binding protein [Actinobacteria bacterium]|nr:ABC transporter substrate-binding protein [Actinomycetota bacterium]